MKRTLRMALAVACILVISICGALVASRLVGRLRVDLTENNIYTLSTGTRNTISKLNQPVELELYYARTAAMSGPEQIRYYNNYFQYVRDLLQEYARLSGGMLELRVIDPRPFSEEEERAIQAGLEAIPLSEDETFFFGLVAETELGKQATIPFFEPQRQQLVEYDISRLISNTTRRAKRKLGIMSSLPVTGSEMSPYMMQMMQQQGRPVPQPWNIVEQLREQFEVSSIPTDAESIPEDVDYLMLVHPKNLSEQTLFAIDQHVMGGGRLVVFTDPHSVADQPMQQPNNPFGGMDHDSSSDLNALLEGWGVRMQPGAVAADRARAMSVMLQAGDRPTKLPVYMQLDAGCVNPQEVVTANLDSLFMLFPGVLERVETEGVQVQPLLNTTAAGATWQPEDAFELRMASMAPGRIAESLQDAGRPLMLGARITGRLRTNFPDGLPQADEDTEAQGDAEESETANSQGAGDEPAGGEESAAPPAPEDGEQTETEAPEEEVEGEPAEPEVLTQAPEGTTVFVFADTDMLSDMVAYRSAFFGPVEAGDNASLVLNTLEFLGGGSDLIAIRSRGRFERPFEVIEQIELEAERATQEQVQALQGRIQEYEQQLRELLSAGTGQGEQLLQTRALEQRQQIQNEIRQARKKLRELNAGRRERIEALQSRIQTHNMVWAPAAVLLIAVALGVARYLRAQRYAARRAEE